MQVYVCSFIDANEPVRATDRKEEDETRRDFTLKYYLNVHKMRYHVCKMFLSTLGVGEWLH